MTIKATFTPNSKTRPSLGEGLKFRPTMTKPRPGRVWYNLLIGGGSSDLSTRCILPEVLKTGYDMTLLRHAKIAAKFGAEGMVIRNPGGCVESMDFDQWLKAWPDGRERAKRTVEFISGMQSACEILGTYPAVYLGSVSLDPYWREVDEMERMDEHERVISASIAFIPNGAPIIIDGAGAEPNGESVSLSAWGTQTLQNRGPVWCEPWPSTTSPWNQSRGFTQSDYYRKLINRQIEYPGKMASGPDVVARQVILVEETPEPSLEEVISWMRLGLTVAVKPDEDGLYQGLNAAQMERKAYS